MGGEEHPQVLFGIDEEFSFSFVFSHFTLSRADTHRNPIRLGILLIRMCLLQSDKARGRTAELIARCAKIQFIKLGCFHSIQFSEKTGSPLNPSKPLVVSTKSASKCAIIGMTSASMLSFHTGPV